MQEMTSLASIIGGAPDTTEMPEEEDLGFLFHHNAIQHYVISREDPQNGFFEFKNFEMRLPTQELRDEFIRVMSTQPAREYGPIIEINEQLARQSNRPIGPKPNPSVVRGAMEAKDILTEKDRARIQAAKITAADMATAARTAAMTAAAKASK
jgi:hypothetical protein